MLGDWFVRALIVQYVLVACAYGWQGAWYKCLYFVSAAGISVAVLKLK